MIFRVPSSTRLIVLGAACGVLLGCAGRASTTIANQGTATQGAAPPSGYQQLPGLPVSVPSGLQVPGLGAAVYDRELDALIAFQYQPRRTTVPPHCQVSGHGELMGGSPATIYRCVPPDGTVMLRLDVETAAGLLSLVGNRLEGSTATEAQLMDRLRTIHVDPAVASMDPEVATGLDITPPPGFVLQQTVGALLVLEHPGQSLEERGLIMIMPIGLTASELAAEWLTSGYCAAGMTSRGGQPQWNQDFASRPGGEIDGCLAVGPYPMGSLDGGRRQDSRRFIAARMFPGAGLALAFGVVPDGQLDSFLPQLVTMMMGMQNLR